MVLLETSEQCLEQRQVVGRGIHSTEYLPHSPTVYESNSAGDGQPDGHENARRPVREHRRYQNGADSGTDDKHKSMD